MTQAQGGGLPVGKILLGCGCISILGAGAVLVAMLGFGVFATKKFVDKNKDKIAESKQIIKTLQDAANTPKAVGAKDGLKEGPKGKDSVKATTLERGEVWKWVKAPLTQDDIDQHAAFMKAWEGTESVKAFKEAAKDLKSLSKKTKGKQISTLDKMKALNKGMSFYKNSAVAMGEFDKMAEQYGGGQKVLGRMFRVVAVIAAAEDVAAKIKKSPESDAVAKKMLALKPESVKSYEKWKEGVGLSFEFVKLMQTAPVDQEKLKAMTKRQKAYRKYTKLHAQKPGMLLLGKMPESSLKLWQTQSVGNRKTLIEHYAMMPSIPHWAFMPKSENTRMIASWLLAHDMLLEQKRILGDIKKDQKK